MLELLLELLDIQKKIFGLLTDVTAFHIQKVFCLDTYIMFYQKISIIFNQKFDTGAYQRLTH